MNLWFCLGRRHTSCRKLFICMSTCLMSIGLSIYLSTYLHIINIYTTRYICMFAVSYCTCMHTWCLVAVAEPEFCSWVFPLSKKSNKNTSSEYRQLKIQAHFLDLTSYSTMN